MIHFAPDFFDSAIPMAAYELSFTTKPFAATVKEFKFYQDPINPEVHEAVATIEFNYPVSPDSLQKNTSLSFLTNKKDSSTAEAVPFTYSYDSNKRVAYLHSSTIAINDVPRYLKLTLQQNIASSTLSTTLGKPLSRNLLIPDSSNFLKIINATANIIRNDKDRPEQVLTIETSIGVNEQQFNKAVHIYVLPKDYPETAHSKKKLDYTWQNPGEVTADILALAKPLSKENIPSETNYATLHSFKFNLNTPNYLYIKIDSGMTGLGGFRLHTPYTALVAVPEYPKEISFLHQGSLLALSGEKKLSVLVRGLPAVKFSFARVLPDNINQLVTQTQGDFNNPYFINPSFNQQNISQIFSETREFVSDLSKVNYTALDLEHFLTTNTQQAGQGPHGLFLLQATAWDTKNDYALDTKASRMILITDLAMLVKDNNDGTHDVFVTSIAAGSPVAGATVTVLGKNGLAISSSTTDEQGRATIGNLKEYKEENEPVVYLAQNDSDVSFIPYNNYNRQLNYSKFDIGGLYTNNDVHSLSAYLFSDRGIYRPGDTVHIGMIIKQAYAQAQPAGLPLNVRVEDSRGNTLKNEQIILNDAGYSEIDFTTNSNAPTGQYTVNLFLVKDNYDQNLLGSTTIQVSEFEPDRMRIKANFSPKTESGWVSPTDLTAQVSLWNLYGAPATNRKVSAKIMLNPQQIHFTTYPDYHFADPNFDPQKPSKIINETLKDSKTDAQGQAQFALHLEQFAKATYELSFIAEGFEADSGKSVSTQIKTVISPLNYFVGYKTEGNLSFITQNSIQKVNFIAINSQLEQQAVGDLKVQLIAHHPVTTLVKKADGTYQYQSIIHSALISTHPLMLPAEGTDYDLPTQEIGDYSLNIIDPNNTVLNQFKFTVVGAGQLPLAKNAELSIKLNKEEYTAGEEIQLEITAPYTGSGLITIERDKVYAANGLKLISIVPCKPFIFLQTCKVMPILMWLLSVIGTHQSCLLAHSVIALYLLN